MSFEIYKPVIIILISTIIIIYPFSNSVAARNEDKNLGWPGTTLEGKQCSGKGQGFGPFDYRDRKYTVPGLYTRHGSKTESPLRFVEKAHFLPAIERLDEDYSNKVLRKGIGNNLDYTLRAFPNHHRALYSMMRYQLNDRMEMKLHGKRKLSKKTATLTPIECYLQRAELFAPEDGTVRMLHGIYLHRRGFLTDALEQYKIAEKLINNNPELLYNIGLLYLDMGEFEKAKEYADRAYKFGFNLPGLKKKLIKAGKW